MKIYKIHTPKVPVNQVSWSQIIKFLRKCKKKFQNPILTYFWSIKFTYKNLKQKINIVIILVYSQYCCHIHVKYHEDWIKTKGVYSIWQEIDGQQMVGRMDRLWIYGQQTAQHQIISTEYVRCGAKKLQFWYLWQPGGLKGHICCCPIVIIPHSGLMSPHLILAEILEQLEHLRSEIPPAAPWLPILVIHIRSQVKTTQRQSYKF